MTAHVGAVLATLGVAAVIVVRNRAWRAAGLAGWAVGCSLLAADLAPAGDTWAYLAGGTGAALAAVGLACVFLRLPWLLVVAVLACVPVRVTVSIADTTAALLVPLYVVVAAAALALGWQLLWKSGAGRELGLLAWPLALFVGWSGVALVWSSDRRQGAIYLLFYLLPFALLAAAAARVPWSEGWATAVYAQLAVTGAVFAAVGIWQYETRELVWSPKAIADGAHVKSAWFYPVDSVFHDRAAYGLFLVLAILGCLVVAQYASQTFAWLALIPLAIAFVGLVPTFSRASYVALGAGVLVSLAALWRRSSVVAVAVAFAALLAVAVGVPQGRERVALAEPSKPVSEGIRLGLDHPLAGVGTGAFERAFAARTTATAPHDTPIRVGAETGALGIALLTCLVAAALVLAFRRNPVRNPTGRARLALGLALIAMAAHSLVDGGLFQDPLFWVALALTAVSARAEAVA